MLTIGLLIIFCGRAQTITWKINDTTLINNIIPVVLGSPKIVGDLKGKSLMFDGVDDGLIMPVNPLEGLNSFTIELLFKPAVSDSVAPRMLHIQDNEGNRCTIELRITKQGKWYLDAFLKNGKLNKGLTLFDTSKQHLCDQWYWVALTYDGTTMMQYVDAAMESKGTVVMNTMKGGQTSIGVRLNHINWFKGQVKEIRFSSGALKHDFMQRKK